MAVGDRPNLDAAGNFEHPLYRAMLRTPGMGVGVAPLDALLTWGMTNSLWIFPMATSCCGIEFMAAAASRVDLDRMGTIVRGTPRQAEVMVVAGTITVKMAPRVLKLWEQMPEPRWCVAMGSCAISGDFYRNLYSVVPGVDTFIPVDVYIPGCPPNPEAVMQGMLRLQEKVRAMRAGTWQEPPRDPELLRVARPSVPRIGDPGWGPEIAAAQEAASLRATQESLEPALDAGEAPVVPAAGEALPVDFETLLRERFGVAELPKNGPPVVPADRHLELAAALRQAGYAIYVTCVAAHWLAGTGRRGKDAAEPEHWEVATTVRSVGKGSRTATWAVRLLAGETIPSLTGVWAGADWQEREQYDLVGVRFAGHPDLRRIMMPENFAGHPLRRDFAIDSSFSPWR